MITLKKLKAKNNKQLYIHLLHNKWDKDTIIDMLEFADIVTDKNLNLKEIVAKYHDDICEFIYEAYQEI